MSRVPTPVRQVLTLAVLAGVSFAAWSAGADLGQADKQATNWTAIGMFGVFVAFTLFITKWAASKTKSAASAIEQLNPHVETELFSTRLVPENALAIIGGYDIVADGSDNFATRYLVNDACYFARVPLVFAALGPFDGYLTTIRSFERDEQGNPRPSYRCLFPEPPPEGTVPPCSEAGILGSVAGVIGCLAATEVVKELLGIGESLVGRLLLYDALQGRFSSVNYAWDPENPLNGRKPRFHDLSHHRAALAEAGG